jgi:hypothetical protein
MATILDVTSFDAALKVHYTADRVADLSYEDNPALAIIPKMEDFTGKNLPIPIMYGHTQGRSATFAKALENKYATNYEDFVLTRAKDYSLADIDGEAMDASKGNEAAFLDATTSEIDSAIKAASRSLAVSLYRDGTGVIGQINATVSGTTVTLAEAQDIVNFEVGQVIYFTSDGTSSGLRDSGDTVAISTVNRAAGTFVVDENLNTVTALASGDYIVVEGDVEAKVKGFAAWIVYGGASATTFFGVNRTLDSTRLGGCYYDGSSQSIEEALLDGMNLGAREGGKPTHIFLNYARWSDLQKALGSKVQYVEHAVGEVGFRGIRIAGPKGFVDVYPDHNCQNNRAWILDMRFWKLYSLGKAPKILMGDGNRMLRTASADSYEVRAGYYAQVGCRAPGFNTVVNLATS